MCEMTRDQFSRKTTKAMSKTIEFYRRAQRILNNREFNNVHE